MDVLDYASYDSIRSLLGVNSTELKDDTVALEVYANGLLMDFEAISFKLVPKYAEVEAIEEASRTAEQRRFYMTARSFAAYSIAKQLCTSLPLFAPKEISDSKTLVGRFAANPYKDTIENVEEQFDIIRLRLVAAFNVLDTTSAVVVTRTLMAVSGLAVDPVTG